MGKTVCCMPITNIDTKNNALEHILSVVNPIGPTSIKSMSVT